MVLCWCSMFYNLRTKHNTRRRRETKSHLISISPTQLSLMYCVRLGGIWAGIFIEHLRIATLEIRYGVWEVLSLITVINNSKHTIFYSQMLYEVDIRSLSMTRLVEVRFGFGSIVRFYLVSFSFLLDSVAFVIFYL